jgi:putative transcriptional regulator
VDDDAHHLPGSSRKDLVFEDQEMFRQVLTTQYRHTVRDKLPRIHAVSDGLGGVAGVGRAEVILDVLLVRMSPQRFAMRLRQTREHRGMTQEALAKKTGVSRAYLSRLEMGRHDPPLSRLRKLARALKVPIEKLLK